MIKTRVMFRVDGSVDIGLGHIIRCIALAQMLKDKYTIEFVCISLPETILNEVESLLFKVTMIESEKNFFSILTGKEIVVLDHYDLDSEYQKKVKEIGSKLVCIDDIHDKEFFADLIINHAPGILYSDYLKQDYTQLALGLDYVLLRPSFLNRAKNKINVVEQNSLFICFGGSDPTNITLRSLNVAVKFKKFTKIRIVIGTSFKHIELLKEQISKHNHVEFFQNINELEMLKILELSDVAIIPASGILFETLCVGCHIISGMYVENQKRVYKSFKDHGVITDSKNFSSEDIENAIKEYFAKDHQISQQFIDGFSKKRINKLFISLELSLRQVTNEDCLLMFNWANNSEVRKNGFNTELIKWEDHKNWFHTKVNDMNTKIFVLEKNNTPVGQIRFDKQNNYWLIDYSIDSEYRRLGLGTLIVKNGIAKINGEVRALVKSENVSSAKVFVNNNFQTLTNTDGVIQFCLDNNMTNLI